MIVLDTTDSIEIDLAGAVTTNELRCVTSWRDITTTAYTPGTLARLSTGATEVAIVVAPAASTQRVVDFINVYNSDTVAATVTISLDRSGTNYTLWSGSLQAGESVQYIDGRGWSRLSNNGVESMNLSGPVDLQVFQTPGAITWNKPTYFTPKVTRVIMYGGGGGGGGGGVVATGTIHTGGSGGGGGCRLDVIYNTADLSSSEGGVVGAAGLSGTAGAAAGGDGGSGGAGGNTTFSSGQKLITAYGGGGGAFGDNTTTAGAGGAGGGSAAAGGTGTGSAATGGGPGAPATPNGTCGANSLATAGSPVTAEFGGGAGGGHTNAPANGLGGGSLFGGCG
jgi:hypothetical protein